jgi:anaerobic magnesium-protoporphyrin IX monomethyl ester cyclase
MVDNLDDLPFPDWGYYSKKYPLKNNFLDFNSKTAIPILASRGCPYSCFNYCTYPLQQGRKVRYRSIENIIDEIKYWKKNLNTNKFIFRDPVFSINRKFTEQLCKRIIEDKLDIVFLVETHLNNLDDELIKLLREAGLKMVYVGVESYESDVLKDINRFTVSNDEQFNVIKKLEDNNIIVKSMFMFGSPADTVKTIKNTIDYSKHLTNQLVQFSIFTPYPGTPMYKNYIDKIKETKYENFNQYKLVYKHEIFDDSKIDDLKSYAYKQFYFRLKKLPIITKSFLSLFSLR